MDSFKDSLAFWSTILGTVVGILGVRLDSGWIALLGFFLMIASSAVLLYALNERRRLKLAHITIEGRKIDSLNVANLGRRLNRSLVVQEADQVATIKGENMTVIWRYAGYCRSEHEGAVDFSIDMDVHIPFQRLDCFAYDLKNDPGRMHPIKPVLLGADGLSKKIAVPLLQPLSKDDPFSVRVVCHIPGCVASGVDYYSCTFSVAQQSIQTSSVRLVFLSERPEWVRAYECDASGGVRLLKALAPSHSTSRMTEYLDLATNIPANAARIYVFHRFLAPRSSVRNQEETLVNANIS
jgi:hypothetical protein